MEGEVLAGAGVLAALAAAVVRLLMWDAPVRRHINSLERRIENLEGDLDRTERRAKEARDEADLWRSRAIECGWSA